jgi:orotidine 5'-phosphate decarboxylase subfamily 1
MRPYALVLSNDVQEPEAMLKVIEQTKDYIDGVKIGITSSMQPGIEIFKKAKEIIGDKAVVLADYKVADIGFTDKKTGEWQGTNEKILRNLAEAGTDYITCHTIVGISSIEESVATAHKHGAKVLTLPFMTHKGAELFFGMPLNAEQRYYAQEALENYGLKRAENEILHRQVEKAETITALILILGHHFGVDGYIGPANNPSVLRTYRYFTESEIWCPGFGRQDKHGRSLEQQIKEWSEIVGKKSAMIVGSEIYKAENPAKAAKEIMEIRDRVVG